MTGLATNSSTALKALYEDLDMINGEARTVERLQEWLRHCDVMDGPRLVGDDKKNNKEQSGQNL